MIYVGIDIVDLMLSLKDVHVEEGTVDDLLDIAAKNLFKTVTDSEDFDYKYYAAILLSVAHSVLEAQRVYLLNMAKTAELSEPEKEIPNDTV